MGNILDYIDWRGDIRFYERPFNEVDNLIFSELAYVNMSGIIQNDEKVSLEELYKRYCSSSNRSNIPMNDPLPLFEKAAACDRFRNTMVMCFTEIVDAEKQIQFSAVTFLPEDNTVYISFRGTDDTIVGWREDCNFSFLSSTPGQNCAVEYVNRIASVTQGDIRIGGHSKGGNFAVYAASFCNSSFRCRIKEVYSNDGPGFNSTIVQSEEYLSILPKVKKILPESSLVGLLLSSAEEKKIVKSTAKGIYQHHPYSWCVTGCGFDEADSLSTESTLMNEALQKWIGNLSDSERKLFVSSVFDFIEASGAETLDDLNKNKMVSYNAILRAGTDFPNEKKTEIFKMLKNFARTSGEIIFNEAVKTFEKLKDQS